MFDKQELEIPMSGPIKIKLVTSNFFSRFPCHVCGGRTERVSVHAIGPEGLQVCETCLKAGDIDDRLKQYADRLDEMASLTRELIGRLQVPTYQQWATAEKRVNDAYGKDLTEAERDALLE
jgi:hypothetical protein